MFDNFWVITLKQQKFSQSDPVLIRQFKKKIAVRSSSDPAKIGFSPGPVLVHAHLKGQIVSFKAGANLRQLRYLRCNL